MNTKPKIILAMPADVEIYRLVERNLAHYGFEVIYLNLVRQSGKFRYPSLWMRLKAKFHKIILRDKNRFKEQLKQQVFKANFLNYIRDIGKVDYALFIRADLYDQDTIEAVKNNVQKSMVAYQWDGMERFPAIWQRTEFFDRFFVFDTADWQNTPHFLPTTNFYFDCLAFPPNEPQYDCYFVGAHSAERVAMITHFVNFAEQNGLKLDFSIAPTSHQEKEQFREHYPSPSIKLLAIGKTFLENLTALQDSRMVLDFLNPIHNGLSFRPFEAMIYRKKLITTNPKIKLYDFYRPENIFVWDGMNFDGMLEWMQQPYQPLPDDIVQKYSFGNWIRYMLDIEPHQKITLPKP